MNLLISLPAGIILIMVSYLFLVRIFKVSVYALGGTVALIVVMVYSMLAAISWPGADVFAIHIALYLLTVYGMTIVISQRRKKSKLHWAPVTLFIFFGIILVTDSTLIFLAQSGMSPEWVKRILPEPRASGRPGNSGDHGKVQSVFPGTVSHDFREKSGQFNEYKQKREQQAALGWLIKLGWEDDAYSGIQNTLFVEIKTRDGSRLKNAEVTARFLYPADKKLDQTRQLIRNEKDIYSTNVILTNPGDWDVVLNIRHATGQYEMRTRTVIKPTRQNPQGQPLQGPAPKGK